jgi:hypothetical protein
MWNSRDRADRTTRDYTEAIHAVNGEHPVEQIRFEPATVAATGLFTAPAGRRFPPQQTLDLAGLVGRAVSASYVPREGERFAKLLGLLETLWERERDAQGRVTLRYVTKVFEAVRR